MLEIKDLPYPMIFANMQKNSFVPVSSAAAGRILWSADYADADPDLLIRPQAVLTTRNNIGVKSSGQLLVYGMRGAFLFNTDIGDGTPVVLGNEALACIKPAYMLEYQDYKGDSHLDSKDFPALQDWANVLMFKPTWDDLLAAVQFTGGPGHLPKEYDVYSIPIEKNTRSWTFSGNGEIDNVLLSADEKTVIVTMGPKVVLLDAAAGEELSSFKPKMYTTDIASVNPEGNLAIIGTAPVGNASAPSLHLYALSGELLWSYRLRSPRFNQPPACGTDGMVFIVDGMAVNCISGGELKWEQPLKSDAPAWLTVTADNHVVCLNGPFLSLFNPQGEIVFGIMITEEAESFDAPVALDSEGRLYVAGNVKLYCLE